jgi:hypothetical protein
MMTLDRTISRTRSQAPPVGAAVRTAALVLLAALAGGVFLGLFSAVGDRSGAPALLHWLANIPGPWVLLAFGLGILAGSRLGGAVAAVIGLGAAVGSYYAYLYFSGERPWLDTVEHAAIVWGFVAIAAGFVFGFAGGSWRRGAAWERIVAVALVCGVLVGESLLVADEQHGSQRFMVATEALFAVVFACLLLPRLRHRVIAMALTCGASVVAIEALIVFSNRLRDAGL